MGNACRRLLAGLCCTVLAGLLAAPVWSQGHGRGLTVSGRNVLRGGVPFVMRGVQVVAFVGSRSVLDRRPWYLHAYESFGRQELETAADVWHANTILFKLGQPELDPQDPLYTKAYLDEAVAAVQLALGMRFAVIVSVDELPPSGTSKQSPLPTPSTARAVATLARLFGDEPDIMIELYNEPFSPTCARGALSNACSGLTPEAWELWRDGSEDGAFVGFNALIRTARESGAKNVLIVQPLQHGGSFSGVPEPLHDPANQLLFAVHPYAIFSGTNAEAWQENFGQFAANHPVLADEWETNTKAKVCDDPPEKAASAFLRFLNDRKIGLIVWSIDLPGTIVRNRLGQPNTFDGFKCGMAGGGAGSLVQRYFESQASQRER